jgi:hypothetical protein
MPSYKPTEPYIIQSGKKQGQSVEQLMFTDYGWLTYMASKFDKMAPQKKNRLHKHIEWVLTKGEKCTPQMICPQCDQRSVAYFSVLGSRRTGYSMSCIYTCCNDTICKKQLISRGIEKTPTLLPLKFSSIKRFSLKHDQRQVVALFKKCFNLPRRLTKNVIFDFFASQNRTRDH